MKHAPSPKVSVLSPIRKHRLRPAEIAGTGGSMSLVIPAASRRASRSPRGRGACPFYFELFPGPKLHFTVWRNSLPVDFAQRSLSDIAPLGRTFRWSCRGHVSSARGPGAYDQVCGYAGLKRLE